MKKILFFINSLAGGGAEKVLVNLLNNLNKEKYDITLLTLFNEGPNFEFLDPTIKRKYIFKKIFKGNTYLLKMFSPELLYKCMVKNHYDIVVSYLEGITARVLSACPDKDTKKISWFHSTVKNKQELYYPVFRSFQEAVNCYNSFDAIVGVSKGVINNFAEQSGIKDNLYVRYNIYETDFIETQSNESFINEDFASNTVNLVTVGRLTPVKGYLRLLNIINKMINNNVNNTNIHLYILGDGEQKNKLEKFILDHQLSNYVTLLGYKNNLYKYVSKADIFVCSSYSEGFSTAVSEALIIGTPVITTRCSGMEELLGDNNEYGIIVDNENEKLYEGIVNLISNRDKLFYYKTKAKERGRMFAKEKTINDIENLLDQI